MEHEKLRRLTRVIILFVQECLIKIYQGSNQTFKGLRKKINRKFRSLFRLKKYGSEPAAIIDMRNKHEACTKQDIELDLGIKLRIKLLKD
jgi:hypothetical protein